MIQEVCRAIADGTPLPAGGIAHAFLDLVSGSATPAQAGAFLFAMQHYPLDGSDLATCAGILLSHARRITITGPNPPIDTCGTGGDHAMTFNISTAAAFVAAGAGIPVFKHGNRAVTGVSGSADVLGVLGVAPASSQAEADRFLKGCGIAFLPAREYHPALLRLGSIRSELGFRTIFNITGPLCHPAGAVNRVLGVADPGLLHPMADALQRLGVSHALVVSGNGLDELSLDGENRVAELCRGRIRDYQFAAGDLGLSPAPPDVFAVSSPKESAAVIRHLLAGGEGPARDIVLLNAAGAIMVGGGGATLPAALSAAERSIDAGRALASLERAVEISGGSV
ncbi:MAG: anthranilate phosphoribosyltransferase [Methanocalculus sp. MSAO_Arc1]|uniref:anthranilate phosphoribosyltransferase n=1 Tax=Methanocalculus TaxID=71151 RepID=UPI000FF272B2|nr:MULTISPECIES: anthranilate phosphoribosyltransferase [unclassified Methanocalculus]MCP1661669.1 anthranilate phosphoribosyltransferase [Methanocalculus sp. AMF5]RQD81413.1 MAG: anthranilate phosphoribosyltransferase [Methanocalculus sp. MSAO_Arc1]